MTTDASAVTLPPDQAARDAIAGELDATLFVEAGAGAGKTRSLVNRILATVAAGTPIESIAAITFTEKAAAELRLRVRARLAAAVSQPDAADPAVLARFADALATLDHAPIGTLHAFARRILNEFPIAAGLPPGFSVLDEIESGLRFDERFESLLDGLLEQPTPASPLGGGALLVELCRFERFGLTKGLRNVAEDFEANWDLVETRVDRSEPPPWAPALDAVLAAAGRVTGLAAGCPPEDTQPGCCGEVTRCAGELAAAPSLLARLQCLEALCAAASTGAKRGNKGKWAKFGGEPALAVLKDAHADVARLATAELDAARTYRKRLVGAIVGGWVLDGAEQRAADGVLGFHDLLVRARRLLTDDADARRQLHARYRKVMLDEFQDTDPLQLAIAIRLTARPDHPGHTDPDVALAPEPGRLFIVGDPKQSIYRFRRADIALYMAAPEQVEAERRFLTANFRSSAAVIGWVNEVFAQVIVEDPGTQPAFRALDVCREGETAHGSVRVLGATGHTDLPRRGGAELMREREADDVADAITTAIAEGWPVADGNGSTRPCRLGDITVLLPARTSLPTLEAALRHSAIPYRAENSSIVYVTDEIRHLLLALRAADDATNELALIAALRTPLYGCTDPHLYEWRSGGGSWSFWQSAPEALADHPVADAIAHIRSLARRSATTAPADLLAALVDERRALDAVLDGPDARDVWRRVRFVIEQARAWSDAGGRGLRRYLRWVDLQASERRSADTVLPEHDHDAVRIMTIHAAKGLEFPITIVSGLSTVPHRNGGFHVVWPGEGWTLAHRNDSEFDDFQPVDEMMSDAERRRLLYVACTRAEDHLVVSLHHQAERGGTQRTSAEVLVAAGAATAAGATPLDGRAPLPHMPAAASAPLEWADAGEWAAARDAALAAAAVRGVISATALAEQARAPEATQTLPVIADPGLDKEPVDLDLPPWQRGRYGTAVGRAVHAVLQFCDLATGADVDHHAAAQCAAEGILGQDQLVAALARSALAAPVVADALRRAHHRELFVAAPVAGRVLEGYIDLFVERADGGVIVDYKTDQWPDSAERDGRIARYRLQLAAYAVALAEVTGRAPAAGVLVRCRPDGPAEQIDIPDWADALAAVRAVLGQPPPRPEDPA